MRALALAVLIALGALAVPTAVADPGEPEEEPCQDFRVVPLVTCQVCVGVLEPMELHLPPDGEGPRFRCQTKAKPPSGEAVS